MRRLMNQMNLMNLLQRLWDEKKFFSMYGCLFAGFWCMKVHRSTVLAVFSSFFYIFYILLCTSMKQMYIDEPLSKFKRFFAFGILTDEPLADVNLHRGSFGSLRNGVA